MKIKNSRGFVFSILDFLKGNSSGKHYNNLHYFIEKAEYDELQHFQNDSIKALIGHTLQSCEYYKSKTYKTLSEFPVVNKKIITDNKSKFLSKSYKGKDLHVVSTSGSTGTPFTIYQDQRKKEFHTADTLFFNELSGLCLGERLYYFRVWDKLVKKSNLRFFIQNIFPIDASQLDCSNLKTNFLDALAKEKSAVSLLAYSSTFEALSNCVDVQNKTPNHKKVNSIITMSETLPDGSRAILEDYFDCYVVSRYSNMENGIIGLQIKKANNYYLLNEVSFFVEILKLEEDTIVENGELGRIVITDLFNYAQPMLRYDTGDIGSICFETYKQRKRRFLKTVEGRKVDFITSTDGLLVSPHTITNTMWRYQFIKQFQFVQTAKESYKLILNTDESNKDKIAELVLDLKTYLGNDALIAVEYTNEIPLLNSGKRKKIVNLYNT